MLEATLARGRCMMAMPVCMPGAGLQKVAGARLSYRRSLSWVEGRDMSRGGCSAAGGMPSMCVASAADVDLFGGPLCRRMPCQGFTLSMLHANTTSQEESVHTRKTA